MTTTDNAPLDELNDAVASMGGKWYKLTTTEHPAIEGEIIAFEKRDKTFEGAIVYKRNTTEPRKEWVFTLKVDQPDPDIADDDCLRKLSLNESGQRAVADAIKEAGVQAVVGGRLKVGVVANGKTSTDQAEYKARYTPPVPKVPVDTSDF